jgi:hypothetical protein
MNPTTPENPDSLHRQQIARQWMIRQIIVWSGFAFLYAAPCFILARMVGYVSMIASVAMFFGVLTFIVGLTAITSTWRWRKWEAGTSFGLALNIGRCLRGVMAVASGVSIFSPHILLQWAYTVDIWSGSLAMELTKPLHTKEEGGLIDTYLTTLLTGLCVLLTLTILTAAMYGLVKAWQGIVRLTASK